MEGNPKTGEPAPPPHGTPIVMESNFINLYDLIIVSIQTCC